MITGDLKSKVDRVWDAFWSGGISNPLEVIEQITYLLFIRRLDDLNTLAEKKAQRTGKSDGIIFGPDQQDLRWSVFKNDEPALMFRTLSTEVFPFLQNLGGDGSSYGEHMKDARFTIPTAQLLSRVVDMLDDIPMTDRDTPGDLYEYLLAKIASAGVNGQFRTPRHIIKLMVDSVNCRCVVAASVAVEQHEEAGGWRLCYASPRSQPGKGSATGLLTESELSAREDALSIRPGQPFLLGPGGAPDVEVLEFFRSPAFRRLAADSQDSYALDLRLFLSFLSGQGVDWRAARESDLEDFEHWRRRDAGNPRRVSAAKFSRELAAIGKFYGWQLRRGTVSTSPVAMRDRETRCGETTSTPALRPKSVRSVRLKWLTPKAYRRWRDVGLAGYLADGTRDGRWRGRAEGRNLVMAETLWSSGLRLREGATLLLGELPQFEVENRYARARVGKAVAKGRGRDFWIHGRALKLVDSYVISERNAAVRHARREGRYDALPDIRIVEKVDRSRRVHYVTRSGQRHVAPLDELSWKDRMTLFVTGEDGLEPWMVWLTDGGMPLPYRTWEAVFSTG